MIKANELRLGNWFAGYNGYAQVTTEHLEYLLNPEFAPHKAIDPIPLAPEILEKAGLDAEDYQWEAGDLRINTWQQSDYGEWTYLRVAKECVQYLHQLQNLYHALTGEELAIDL